MKSILLRTFATVCRKKRITFAYQSGAQLIYFFSISLWARIPTRYGIDSSMKKSSTSYTFRCIVCETFRICLTKIGRLFLSLFLSLISTSEHFSKRHITWNGEKGNYSNYAMVWKTKYCCQSFFLTIQKSNILWDSLYHNEWSIRCTNNMKPKYCNFIVCMG